MLSNHLGCCCCMVLLPKIPAPSLAHLFVFQVLGGDDLAAEYLLLQLVGRCTAGTAWAVRMGDVTPSGGLAMHGDQTVIGLHPVAASYSLELHVLHVHPSTSPAVHPLAPPARLAGCTTARRSRLWV